MKIRFVLIVTIAIVLLANVQARSQEVQFGMDFQVGAPQGSFKNQMLIHCLL